MIKKLGLAASLGLGFIALGFIVIGIAWNGAASLDYAQGQIPFLISGGATGLGFIGLGVGLLLFEAGRRARAQLEQKVDALIDAVHAAGGGGTAEVEVMAPAEAASNGLVVVGRSSFHRPDCRLVAGKENVTYASPDEASARGLYPCRVCDPTRVPR